MQSTDTAPAFAEDVSNETLQQHVAAGEKASVTYIQIVRVAIASLNITDEVTPTNVDALALIAKERAPAYSGAIQTKRDILLRANLARVLLQKRLGAKVEPPPVAENPAPEMKTPATGETETKVETLSNGQWKERPAPRIVHLPDPAEQRKKARNTPEPDKATMEAEAGKLLKGLDETAPLDAAAASYVKGMSADDPLLKEKLKDTEPEVKRRKRTSRTKQEDEEESEKTPEAAPGPVRPVKKEKEPVASKSSADSYASAMNNAEVAREELAELINDTPILQDLLTYAIEMTDEEKKNYGGPSKQKRALLEEFGKVLRGVRAARVRKGFSIEEEYADDQLTIHNSILIVIADLLDPELQGNIPVDEKSEFADDLLRHYKKFDGDTRGPLKELLNRIQRGEKALKKQIAEIGNIDSFVLRFVPNFQKFRPDLKEAGRNALYSAIYTFDGSEPLGTLIERMVLEAIEKAKQGMGKKKRNT